MFNSKAKGGNLVPSDAQAREKLAVYVYEYLLHSGAQKAAESFLREIRWEKSISLGEAPGFLHSWWCVFWDLYCAAPERREHNDHTSEAKAFHDYGFVAGQQNNGASAPPPPPAAPQYINGIQHNSNAPSPLGQMPPTDGMPGGPMPPAGFFPNSHMRPSPPQQPVNQPSPLSQPMMPNQAFISPRFPGGPGPGPRHGVRMPQQVDFNQPPGGVPGQPMMPNMDPNRQGTFITSDGTEFVNWQGPPPGMQQMNPRMAGPHPPPPRVPPMGQLVGNMGQFPPSMRPPNGPNGPPVNGQNGQQNGQQLPPLNMPGPGGPPGRPWQPNNNQMTYNSSSPGNHYGPPGSNSGPGPAPGTPIMPSPQGSAGPYSPASHRMGTPNTGRGEYLNDVELFDY